MGELIAAALASCNFGDSFAAASLSWPALVITEADRSVRALNGDGAKLKGWILSRMFRPPLRVRSVLLRQRVPQHRSHAQRYH